MRRLWSIVHATTALILATSVLATSGCATSTEASDVAAKIAAPTAESRAELRQAVMNALDGTPVTLADDALTRESILTIERQQARDSSGRRIDAREVERPELFRLVKHGSDCVLVHERTRSRMILRSARCE
jgi:hypothetical protein